MSLLCTVLVGKGNRADAAAAVAGQHRPPPAALAETLWPVGWSRRTVILLVMQTLDNAIALRASKRWFGRGYGLRTEQDPDKPNPTFIAGGNAAAAWLAEHTGGIAQSSVLEAMGNIPTTAHILGGAVIGADAATGVVDRQLRVFGYENLLVCDGAAMPANPGVNPSLTITALAEHAMAQVPARRPTRGGTQPIVMGPCAAVKTRPRGDAAIAVAAGRAWAGSVGAGIGSSRSPMANRLYMHTVVCARAPPLK